MQMFSKRAIQFKVQMVQAHQTNYNLIIPT